jgi:hypothetical protein
MINSQPFSALTLDACIVACLKQKSERTGIAKTKLGYTEVFNGFRTLLHAAHPIPLDLDSTDVRTILLAAYLYAAGTVVSPGTFNQCLSILSSF